MTDEEILDIIQEKLDYHLIIWYDGEHYQLKCTKKELYQGIYEIRKLLRRREDVRQRKDKSESN